MIPFPTTRSLMRRSSQVLTAEPSWGEETCPHQQFLQRIYRDLLDRPVYGTDRAYFGRLLRSGVPRRRVIGFLLRSREYGAHWVQSQHRRFLGRPAEVVRLLALVEFLRAGGTTEQVQVHLLSSAAYYQERGEGTVSGFLAALY